MKRYKSSEMLKLAEEYSIKNNLDEICEREDIPKSTMFYYIKKLGYNKPNRKHFFNEDYFNIIDSEAKAYLLGFIMADGCVSKSCTRNPKPNRLNISISQKDRQVLELLKAELNCSYEIVDMIPKGTYSENPISRIIINSQKMCEDLSKYGIVERKTGKEILPELSDEMYRHFIRGFLDGDGYVTNKGKTIGFVSNDNMLSQLKEKLVQTLKLTSVATIRPDNRNKPVSYLEFHTAHDIDKLKEYLYENTHYYLDRKYSKLT